MKRWKQSCTVVSISIFGRFNVYEWPKRIKKYAFSYENGSVWTGQNKTKMLCGREYIFFFRWEENFLEITCSSSPNLSLKSKESKDIKSCCVLFGGRSRSLCRQTIGYGGTVAAYVAETGQRLFVRDILGVLWYFMPISLLAVNSFVTRFCQGATLLLCCVLSSADRSKTKNLKFISCFFPYVQDSLLTNKVVFLNKKEERKKKVSLSHAKWLYCVYVICVRNWISNIREKKRWRLERMHMRYIRHVGVPKQWNFGVNPNQSWRSWTLL